MKELSQTQQYKHFYTTGYKSNKERVYKAQSDDQISDVSVPVNLKLQQYSEKQFLIKQIE